MKIQDKKMVTITPDELLKILQHYLVSTGELPEGHAINKGAVLGDVRLKADTEGKTILLEIELKSSFVERPV